MPSSMAHKFDRLWPRIAFLFSILEKDRCIKYKNFIATGALITSWNKFCIFLCFFFSENETFFWKSVKSHKLEINAIFTLSDIQFHRKTIVSIFGELFMLSHVLSNFSSTKISPWTLAEKILNQNLSYLR